MRRLGDLDVLEDTPILCRIPVWRGSDRASLVAHPKVRFFDLGVRNAILRRPLDRPLDDERGLLLEHLVGLELRRRKGTVRPEARVHHFGTRRGAEVDFVVSVGEEHRAIEVKDSRNVDARNLKGVVAFTGHARNVTRQMVVFLGPRRQRTDGVEVLPLQEFLAELPA